MDKVQSVDDLFNPSLAAALIKLDPKDGEQIVDYLRTQALLVREKQLLQTSVRDQKKLLVENGKLKKDIEQLRTQLQDKQRRRTAKALLSPAPPPPPSSSAHTSPVTPPAGEAAAPPPCSHDHRERRGRRRRGERKGESREEGGLVVLLCNVKARKVRGVVSQARLLCCSAPDGRREPLAPPTGSSPGDRITFLNYPGEPDRVLQSRDRIWQLLQPDLQVDSRGVANYKGRGFEVRGKGLCRAPSLTNAVIG
ncbi:aminoacyl tRNA synthase complex-interacting multifunctional protein 1-like [Pungitius pungitius]|uniref:aminoacyl tRNA synthase complex-interacting multifunctional protein 1-like n=1 Tax=Pungitius pungitius TaxID=134920 RepID=UPI002E0EA4BF